VKPKTIYFTIQSSFEEGHDKDTNGTDNDAKGNHVLRDTIRRKQDQNFCFSDGMSLEILGKTTKNVPFLVQFTLFLSFFRPNDHPICCSDCVTRMRPAKISRRPKYWSSLPGQNGGRLKCLTHVLSIWPSAGWQKQTWQPFLGAWQICFRIWRPSWGWAWWTCPSCHWRRWWARWSEGHGG